MKTTVGCFIACMAVILPLRGAMQLYDYAASSHDRFYTGNDRAFIAESVDLSGVGIAYWQTDTDPDRFAMRFGTLITPTFFLSANHYHPPVGRALTLYPGNDPEDPNAVERTIQGGQQILDSDLWLGWFAEDDPVPEGIATYSLFPDYGAGFVGHEVLAIGKDEAVSTTSQRAGRNIVDGVGTEAQLFAGAGNESEQLAVYSYEDEPGIGVGADEFRYVGGDSGGPTFVTINGIYALFGINYFIYDANDIDPSIHDPDHNGSGCTRVPAYIDAINQVMMDMGREDRLTLVPEPAMAALSLVAICLSAMRRDRRIVG